jgi:hypothetical protein
VELDLGNACSRFDPATLDEVRAIAVLHEDDGGLVTKLAGWIGNKAENVWASLPVDWQGVLRRSPTRRCGRRTQSRSPLKDKPRPFP